MENDKASTRGEARVLLELGARRFAKTPRMTFHLKKMIHTKMTNPNPSMPHRPITNRIRPTHRADDRGTSLAIRGFALRRCSGQALSPVGFPSGLCGIIRCGGSMTCPRNFNTCVIFDFWFSSVKPASIGRHDQHRVEVVSKYSDVLVGGEARFSRAKLPLRDTRVSKYRDSEKKSFG